MDSKLFLSTFALIFLAELGDKTQLAAMARSASGGKFTVFLAASTALVLSTLIAVAFGSTLHRYVPEIYINVVSGVLFVIFGIIILYSAFKPTAAPVAAVHGEASVFARVAMRAAVAFEDAAATDYAALAKTCDVVALRALLLELAADEKAHLDRLRGFTEAHDASAALFATDAVLPEAAALEHDVATAARPMLNHAIEHEEATAVFYEKLARVAHLPALKSVMSELARQEHEHARRLRELAGGEA